MRNDLFNRPLKTPMRFGYQRNAAFLAGMIATIVIVTLLGCGTLLPRRVELFQDKVRAVPVATTRENEVEKQAAAAAADTAQQTLLAAVKEDASTSVIYPATDTAALTRAVSTSVGPPLTPWKGDFQLLAAKLDSSVAALDRRLESFKKNNDENAGKRIEGTGLLQVPYFVWLGGAFIVFILLLVGFSVLWMVLKTMASANPIASLGVRAVEMGAQTATRGFTQLVAAGEQFKDKIKQDLDPAIATKVLEMFRTNQQIAQDHDIKQAVDHLTKP